MAIPSIPPSAPALSAFYGAFATTPTTRPSGAAMQYGDMYLNTSASPNSLYVYTSTGWQSNNAQIAALILGQGAGVIGYVTLAAMNADLAHTAQSIGYVTNDPTQANNTIYIKLGASGAGSWQVSTSTPAQIVNTKLDSLIAKWTPRSGYLWGVTDVNKSVLPLGVSSRTGRPLALGRDFMKELDVVEASAPKNISTRSGYLWGFMDVARSRVPLGVSSLTGRPLALGRDFMADIDKAISTPVTPSTNLAVLGGDSLTAGAGGQTSYFGQLAQAWPNRKYYSTAVGGQTSTQQASACGVYPSLMSVAGNQIPASGSVSVTARTVSLLTSQGYQSINGSLGGVYGTLIRATDDSYTFTRSIAGSASWCPPSTPFGPDMVGTHIYDTQIIFVGQNNLNDPATAQRDIALLAGAQGTLQKRFLILTPPGAGAVGSGTAATGGDAANALTIENWAVQAYGDRVLRVRQFSFQFGNGGTDDNADIAAGATPRSLRVDTIHFTTAFHGQIMTWVQNELTRRGW